MRDLGYCKSLLLSFREVILIDADVLVFIDPTTLFPNICDSEHSSFDIAGSHLPIAQTS